MKISEEDLRKFQELYKKHFNEVISEGDAAEKAMRLINLMKAVVSIKHSIR